jgi:hypothetical protein
MRNYLPHLGVLCLLFGVPPCGAADLTQVQRTIAKEPKYQGKPAYCLLVLGPEAKFRVWLVVDGAVLYVDRNGDGDLTGMDERVSATYNRDGDVGFRTGLSEGPEGKAQHTLRVGHSKDGCYVQLRLDKTRSWQLAGFDGPGPLAFAARPLDAPIVHLLGPLTLQRFEPQSGSISPHLKPLPLVRGEVNNLAFSVGTPGLGAGTFAKYPDVPSGQAELRFANGKTIAVELKPDG